MRMPRRSPDRQVAGAGPRWLAVTLGLAAASVAVAAVAPADPSRFDHLVRPDPSTRIGLVAEPPGTLPDFDEGRAAWEAFRAEVGGDWRIYLDRRTGVPALVEGSGVPWFPAENDRAIATSEFVAAARRFVSEHSALFRVRPEELTLSTRGSGALDADHRVLVFDRSVGAVPVENQRFVLYVTRGRLVAFGADRWGEVGPLPDPVHDVDAARAMLHRYMGIRPGEAVEELESGRLVLVAEPVEQEGSGPYAGPVGSGIRFRLVRRFSLRVTGVRSTWVGKVDAVSGEVLALYDDNRYERVAGGVFPESNDGNCPEGCEQAGTPMPYADVSIDGVPAIAGSMGLYECPAGGGTAATTLAGPFVRIEDACGAVSESAVCGSDLDLGQSAGTDCAVPAGASAGNTHASRTSFYHLNRMKEKSRAWLPNNVWIDEQLVAHVNGDPICDAFFGGDVFFFRSVAGSCRNSGEIAGVINHEYGHGLDFNDGGGFDNPYEAYADVVALLQDRHSCIGRGLFFSPCSGFGDACLTCTGVRELDWDQRAAHTPATPQGFVQTNCPLGVDGPCGGENHCEGIVAGETVYDLAVRDLPALGLDPASAWQLTEKLFYRSRQGSGGNAYNCDLGAGTSDGCNVGSWFTKFRVVDDDDGDLSNGTPHASAIFAAFDRHAIACGSALDPSNQDSSGCPALAAPLVDATAGSGSAALSWQPVTGADGYRILRNDQSCTYSDVILATLPAPLTRYTDVDLPDGRPVFYRVQAVGASSACESPVSACSTVTPLAPAGTIRLDRAAYGCSTPITVEVRDANIGSSTTTATIFSDSEPIAETVTLTETRPGSGLFVGGIATSGGPASGGDDLLALQHGDRITARYVDADDGQGGLGLTREAGALGDCVPAMISGVTAEQITDTQAEITWHTDEVATSSVRWGETAPPANTTARQALVNDHRVTLVGLQECTAHIYSVESEDRGANLTIDDNGGLLYAFETLGDFGSGLVDCHAGTVLLEPPTIACGDTLAVRLVDLDLNLSPTVVETATVDVTSSTETTPVTLTVVETGPNTSQFTAGLPTATGAPAPGDGILQASHGDLLTATYHDADDGTGAPAVVFATGAVDCLGPVITALRVANLTDEQATIEWTTDEPASGRLDWGATPALGDTVSDAALTTSHALTIGPLATCARVHFRVSSTDAQGNTTAADAEGNPFGFNVSEIPGLVFKDQFEADGGWTREGEWQIDAPAGLGGTPGLGPDPVAAFEGSQVLGHDLTGLGANLGEYEPGRDERAISPVIDASTLANGELVFRRWLNVAFGATASIEVANGGFNTVWSSPLTGQFEFEWALQSVDISAFADGNPTMQIAYRLDAGGFAPAESSWNVDLMIVKDGSRPLYEGCGGCGGAPAFAGATGATDADPCGDTGIEVFWDEAPAWGTGNSGTYSVYRDTTAGFTPAPANRVATGVAGTSWTDALAPDGVTLFYLVRAENEETCSTGPSNGGVTDANLVYVSARDEASQPVPGSLADSLRVSPVNDAHVRLDWSPAPDAARYNVYRADAPQGPFSRIAEVATTFHEEPSALGSGFDRYYRVHAADACGNESP